jgi:Na+/melibiose symporter-like transporter
MVLRVLILPVIVIVGAILAVFVSAVMKGARGKGWVVIIPILAVVFGMAYVFWVSLTHRQVHVVEPIATDPLHSERADRPAPIWTEGIEEQFGSQNVQYADKPWVDDFAEFVNKNPSRIWVLGLSQEACMSQAEAERQAMADACAKIARILNASRQQRGILTEELTVVPADLQNGGFVTDKFAQSFSGTAGLIWRQAILIDASQDKLNKLAREKAAVARVQRTTWAQQIGAAIGVVILICLVYLFLNAATKGYYTWSLRVAALVLIAAGVLLVLTLV